MNQPNFKENWNEPESKPKQELANLIDDDLLFTNGKEKKIWGRMKNKRGRIKEEIRKIISKF